MRFYRSIESMLAKLPNYNDPFVTQWEIPEPRDDCDRLYIVFDGVEEYLAQFKRGRYTTCHECFIPTRGTSLIGHPAFDIDMELQPLPHGWEDDLLLDMMDALKVVFPEVTIDELVPVWMTGSNPSKISRHLTIRNVALTSWADQMKELVKAMHDLPRPRSGPSIMGAIDTGIYRRHGSLRLPMNGKKPVPVTSVINGREVVEMKSYPLLIDDPSYTILDGLVLIHEANMYTMDDAVILSTGDMVDQYKPMETIYEDDYDVDQGLVGEAFTAMDRRWDTGLKLGMGMGKFMPLTRSRPGRCPISSIVHENDNAYILATSDGRIMYGCHRGCKTKKGSKLMDITPHKKSRGEINASLCMSMMHRLGINM